mmetsp:Transcript_48407/g.87609  ORF Transcript_48407/g.87609 Transcript_48407/m.87609 type:complete len:433 (-) Transcript_48407:331-1629(-)
MPSLDPDASILRRNFLCMLIPVGINQAALNTVLVYASTVQQHTVGYTGSAVLNVASMVSSLTLASFIIERIGVKGGIIVGMSLSAVYIFCSAVATDTCANFRSDGTCDRASTTQWLTFVIGSATGGLATGIIWSSQGTAFARYAHLEAEVRDQPAEEVSAELAGLFAFAYLSAEMLLKAVSSLLIKLAGMKASTLFYMYAAVAAVPMISTILATPPASAPSRVHVCAKVAAAVAIWPDVKLWLLAFTNLTFGFSAAFMNGYVNVHYAAHDLGADALGFLSAATVLAAVLSTRVYALIPQKSLVAFLGSIFFALVAIIAQGDVIRLWSLSSWGWGLTVLYALQGFGRGVYESTNKSIFADVFPCARYPGFFANVIMQNSFAFTVCFFLSDYITKQLGWIVFSLAVFTYPSMVVALHLKCRQDRQSEDAAPVLG